MLVGCYQERDDMVMVLYRLDEGGERAEVIIASFNQSMAEEDEDDELDPLEDKVKNVVEQILHDTY